jgi:hypothetical protein
MAAWVRAAACEDAARAFLAAHLHGAPSQDDYLSLAGEAARLAELRIGNAS